MHRRDSPIRGVRVDRPRTLLELAREAIAQTIEPGALASLSQDPRTGATTDAGGAHPWIFNAAQQPTNSVSQRRGMRLVRRKFKSSCWAMRSITASGHRSVIRLKYSSYRECMSKAILLYVVGACALGLALRKLLVRLQLSRAKHRSLAGHSRMGSPLRVPDAFL